MTSLPGHSLVQALIFENLELEDLQRLIDRCEAELAKRRRKPVSEEDAMLSLSAQLAAHRRQKENEIAKLRAIFR